MRNKCIFLIGNPASGKTTFYNLIRKKLNEINISTTRINDRDFFWKTIRTDENQKLHKRRRDNSVKVTDNIKFNKLLFSSISSYIEKILNLNKLIFIELTSNDMKSSISHFKKELLLSSYLILFCTNIYEAKIRNEKRNCNSKLLDDRKIPNDYLIECYLQNFDLTDLRILFYDSYCLINDSSNLDDLVYHVDVVLKKLLIFIKG